MSGLSFSNAHDLIDFHNVKMLQGALKKYCVFIHHSIDVETEKHYTTALPASDLGTGNRDYLIINRI